MTVVRQMDDAHGSNSVQFKAALRRAIPSLPDLPAVQEEEPLIWTRVTLPSVPGKAKGDPLRPFGAFRFRSPLSGPADLYWAYCCDEPGIEWYIIPDKGAMRGFQDFSQDWLVDIPGVPLPRDNELVLQELTGGQILPDRDYIIWMSGPEGRSDVDVQCALRLVPSGTFPWDHRLETLARRLDLKYGYQQVPATPEGLLEAGQLLSDLHSEDGMRVELMRRTLEPVAERIAAAEIGTSGPARWTRVTPLAPRFAALRFRSPLDVPARLCACYVVPEEQLQWGLIPPKERPTERFNLSLEVNCPLPGTANPIENLAMFATLPDDLILPGEDYLLWFTPSRGILADFDITLRLVPESETALPQGATGIADRLGLSIPATPTPERIAAALRRCQGLVQEKKHKTRSFARLLDFLGPWLPPLVEADGASWRTIAPGHDEPQFAAFCVDLRERSQVVCALACPLTENLKWGFFDSNGIWSHAVSTNLVRHDVQLDGIKLPDHNTLLLETGVCEVREGAPGERVVFFVSGFEDKPLEAWLKATVVPLPSGEPVWGFSETARHVGVRLQRSVPFGRTLATLPKAITGSLFLNPQEIVTCAPDGRLSVWNSESGELLRQSPESRGEITDAWIESVRRDGGGILTRQAGRPVVYDSGLSQVGNLSLPTNERDGQFALLAGGKRLVGFEGTSGYARVLNLWDLQSDSVIRRQAFPLDGSLSELSSAGTPELLVAAMYENRVRQIDGSDHSRNRFSGRIVFLDPDTLEEIRTVSEDLWQHCVLTHDASRLFAINRAGLIQFWKTAEPEPLVTFAGQGMVLVSSASDDGRVLATWTRRGAIQVWDVDRARLIRSWTPEGSLPVSLGLSPDGRKLAIGSDDQQVWIADIPAPASASDSDADFGEMTDSTGIRLVRIPAGRFRMGSLPPGRYKDVGIYTLPSQLPERAVTISKAFRIGACEVTVGQFRKFVEATGHRTSAEVSGRGGQHVFRGTDRPRLDPSLNWKNPGFEQTDDHPVVHVTHSDAVAFCDWLSKVEGVKYRLPTEAEWEYSARGGTDTLNPNGDDFELFDRTSNIADKRYKEEMSANWGTNWDDGFAFTAPVASFLPNGFGLHDTIGNVWEWCSDYYDQAYYSYGPAVDPPGAASGQSHSVRGSSYEYRWSAAYCAFRESDKPETAQSSIGFRVVREIP